MLGHSGAGNRGDHLGPVLGDTAGFIFSPDHEPGDILQEKNGRSSLTAQFHKMGALQGAFRKKNAVVADDADGVAVNPGKAADQGGAVFFLKLVKLGSVHDPGDNLPDVIGGAGVPGQNAVDLPDIIGRRNDPAGRLPPGLIAQIFDDVAGDDQGFFLVFGKMIGHPGPGRMHFGPAQFFGCHDFTGGGLDQGRPAQKNRAVAFDDDGFIGHGRHIGAAGRAGPEYNRYLRNPLGRHHGLVEENPSEMLLVRKHLVLHG